LRTVSEPGTTPPPHHAPATAVASPAHADEGPAIRLSAILIVRNAAEVVRDCLESVRFADEIVVLDSGSTDDTVAICRQYTERVEVTDWPGFGPQKNRALDRARGTWVLSIDADERVPPALRAEIEAAMARDDGPDAYRMPRRSWYCGRWIRHSGWTPDYVVRLVRRGTARFTDSLVHESLAVRGPVGTLRTPLLHLTFRSAEEVLAKVNSYSTAGAEMLHARGRRAGLGTAIGRGFWAFVRTYFLRLGFLDGRQGFMLAFSNAEGTYYRYVKLMLRQEPP
jgi:glycosyltransferase involved in cell wall biosynthesis